jgi:hypothetical protein
MENRPEQQMEDRKEDIAEQLALRDRFLRNRRLRMTPEQRMEEMHRLQTQAWATLKMSPKGYAHFMARNFKTRAIDVSDTNGG